MMTKRRRPQYVFEAEELYHSVIRIPRDYEESAQFTLESIYGGAIENIRIRNHTSDDAVKYAYVAFESYEVAARALSTKHFWPNGELIDITREPAVPPEACQATHFDVLNTDCLFHLYKYLNPVDIARASEALQCLSQFAKENIYQKYAKLNVFQDKFHELSKKYVFNEFKYVFKHFGEFVTHCYISANQLNNPSINHIRAIMQYCPNLYYIKFAQFTFGPTCLEVLSNEPLRATKAHFSNCSSTANNWSALWAKWQCLRSLTMYDLNFDLIGEHFLDGLTNLEKMSFQYCTDLDEETVIDAIGRNRTTLTTFCLVGTNCVFPELFDQLFEIAPNLGDLVVNVEEPAEIGQLHKLNNLKKLQLVVVSHSANTTWSANLESLKTLEDLEVDLSIARTIEMSAKMPTLQVLRICFPFFGYLDIFEIVSNLPNLKTLFLSNCPSRWDDVDTIQILERNLSIEEIVLEYCSYGCTAVPMLVEALTKQKNSMEVPRPQVRVTVVDCYKDHEDFDHPLVKIVFKPDFDKVVDDDIGQLDKLKPHYSSVYVRDPNTWCGLRQPYTFD